MASEVLPFCPMKIVDDVILDAAEVTLPCALPEEVILADTNDVFEVVAVV